MKFTLVHPSSLLGTALLAASMIACTTNTSNAQHVLTSQVVQNVSYCDHVIEQIARHGVNNSVDTSGGASMFHPSPFGSFAVPQQEFGDLEVVSVSQFEHIDATCGPKISVVVHNNSLRKVCSFQVSAVAIFGHICSRSPNATVRVEAIEPGQAFEVCLQLPIEALAMGNRNGQVLGFQRLVVVIDSYDELLETNEANNVKAFDAAAIPFATVAVQQTVVEQNAGEQVVPQPAIPDSSQSVLPQSGSVAVPAPATGEVGIAPSAEASPSPVETDALRSAINMLDTEAKAAGGSL